MVGKGTNKSRTPTPSVLVRVWLRRVKVSSNNNGREMKSVLKKVKDKDRKLKETITKHEQARVCQEHDHRDDVPDDHDHDEEEDEEEMVVDPEVHAAQSDKPTAVATEVDPRSSEPGKVKNQREEFVPAPATTLHSIIDRGSDPANYQTKVSDPQSPTRRTNPPNYQTKVSNPTGLGSEEADVSQLIQSIGTMAIEAEPESGAERDHISTTGTGSHDQCSPETVRESNPVKDGSEKRASKSCYAEKISSLTAAIAEKATSAKDVVASKLGYADKVETGIKDQANATAQSEQTSNKGIVAVVTEKLSPVYKKVVETGSTAVSKVREGSGATGGKMDESTRVDTAKGKDKGVSVKEYVAEKLKPREEDKALSQVISETVGYLHGKSGESPPPQASGSGPNEGKHRSEGGVAETGVDLDEGKEM